MAVTSEWEQPYAFSAVQVVIPAGALVGSLLAGVRPLVIEDPDDALFHVLLALVWREER